MRALHPEHAARERRDDGNQVLDELVVHRTRRRVSGDRDGRAVAREALPQVLEHKVSRPVLVRGF